MTKPGRIPCINPRCRRTAADSGQHEQICCGKCWKLVPLTWRRRHKRLNAAIRQFERRGRDASRLEYLHAMNWRRIWVYFNKPDKPEGIDNFIDEIGLK